MNDPLQSAVARLPSKYQSAVPSIDSRPRVGLFSPGLMMGGAERWVVELGKYLDRNRVRVSGIAVRDWDCDKPLLAKAALNTGVYIGPKACKTLFENSDIIIFWGTGELPAELPSKAVYVSHGAGDCAKKWAPTVMDMPVELAAVSRWASSVFPGRDTKVIHNGVDHQRLQARVGRGRTRQKWGLKPDDIAVGYIGRFSQEKNPAAAARAAVKLGLPYRGVYVGSGPSYVTQALRQFSPEPLIVPRVEEVGDAYAALDCFVLASKSEGFSLALTEAWMCGIPTVTTPVGAIPELEERFGQLAVHVPVDPTDEELAAAVLIAMLPENREIVDRARQVAHQHFTAEAMGQRWTDYVLEVLDAS